MYHAVTNTRTEIRPNTLDVAPLFGSTKLTAAAFRGAMLTLAMLSAALMIASRPAMAQYETLLYNFPEDPYGDAAGPTAQLTPDGAGNFYGTTRGYGAYNAGSVFEVFPNGSEYEATLYSFTGGADGSYPGYSPVTPDKKGNLYGTTACGGANGCGVVFELTPEGVNWTESVLYSFPPAPGNNENDNNCTPLYGVIIDKAGHLYGTTSYGVISQGGSTGHGGAVFELIKSAGVWKEKLLYTYAYGSDSGLTMDAAGNLYGIAANSDDYPYLFELSPNGKGGWNPTVIYTFTNFKKGTSPTATPVLDAAGNLYGTTGAGGAYEYGASGVVYEASPITTGKKAGQWTYKVLFSFNGRKQGGSLFGGVVLDASGDIYGTTQYGGKLSDGTVFELVPPVAGKSNYTENVLMNFNGEDGSDPVAGVTLYDGNLYGTTSQGGAYSAGVVFEVTP
jgi:uncharacterized repeat protein (TIGR03803 family)